MKQSSVVFDFFFRLKGLKNNILRFFFKAKKNRKLNLMSFRFNGNF